MNLDCGNSASAAVQCPSDVQEFKCHVQGGSMEWESLAFEDDIEFFGSDIGTMKQDGLFTAQLTNKTVQKTHAESTLSFPSDVTLNGTSILCRDNFDGDAQTCIIMISYPGTENSQQGT